MTHFLRILCMVLKMIWGGGSQKTLVSVVHYSHVFSARCFGKYRQPRFSGNAPPLSKMQGANWNWRATRSCVRQFVHAILSHTPKFNVSKLGALCAWHCGCRDREEGVVMGQAGDPVAQGWLSRPSLPNHQHFASHVVPHVTSLFGHDCNLGKIQDTWFMCTQFF